jgi:hypothetical protein
MKLSPRVLMMTLPLLAGCFQEPILRTRLELTTFETGKAEPHYADFSRASYRRSPDGLLEVAMRTERPSTLDPTQIITQVVYIRTFWNPRPGKTFAESTQINARVEYAMLTPPTGIRYDGSAFLTYDIDRNGTLIGRIESGTLAPRFHMGDAAEPFGPARFSGGILAVENPREVVSIAQTLDSEFSEPIPTK